MSRRIVDIGFHVAMENITTKQFVSRSGIRISVTQRFKSLARNVGSLLAAAGALRP
jgi:hypothetical protein